MQELFFKKALSTTSVKEFRSDLFNALDAYIDANEENRGKIADFAFIEEIHVDVAMEKVSLKDIVKKIDEHILGKGYENVHQVFQELSALSTYSKYEEVFLEDEEQFSDVKKDEPTKDKVKNQITNFSNPSDHRDEFVRLMMHDRSLNFPYNGHLVDANRFSMLSFSPEELSMEREKGSIEHTKRENRLLFEEIDRVINEDNSGNNRIQIIVKSGPHYTTLDIDKKNRSCFIIDAADDARQNRLHLMPNFSKLIDKVVYVKSPSIPTGKGNTTMKAAPQKDDCSCSIFALDHSFTVATYPPDLHEWLGSQATLESGNRSFVTWDQLPPEMVKNSQSTTIIQHYVGNNPGSIEQIEQLTGNNTRNYGFEATKNQYSQTVKHYCKTCEESEFKDRLNYTTSHPSTQLSEYDSSPILVLQSANNKLTQLYASAQDSYKQGKMQEVLDCVANASTIAQEHTIIDPRLLALANQFKLDGNDKYQLGNYEDALLFYKNALTIYQEFCPHLLKTHGVQIASETTKIMSNMLKVSSHLHDYDEAVTLAEKTAAFAQEHNVKEMLAPSKLPKTIKELGDAVLEHSEKDNWAQKIPLLNKLVQVMVSLKQNPKDLQAEIERLEKIREAQQLMKEQMSGLQSKPTTENTTQNTFDTF